jgi:hypothetical protein
MITIEYMANVGLGDTKPSQIIKKTSGDGNFEILTCNQFVGWRDNPAAMKHFILPDGAEPIDAKKAEAIVEEWSKNWPED